MPRDAAGVFSLVPSYQATVGETIDPSQHNPPLEDIATALTGSLPRNGSAGMTGPLALGGNRVTGAAAAVSDTDLTTKGQVSSLISSALANPGPDIRMPTGAIIYFAMALPLPAGWLLCDGSAVSRTQYSALFGLMETFWGTGDGTTTFNLPDFRGMFLRGYDGARGIDPGRTYGSDQADALRSHAHTINDPGHSHDTPGGPNAAGSGTQAPAGQSGNTFIFGSKTASIGTGITVNVFGGTETRPRNMAISIIIKT